MPCGYCHTMTRQCHWRMIHFRTKQRYILQIRRKQEWWILERNKKLRTIVLGNLNKTRTNSFLEMGKSSSNVSNVFKGSSLTATVSAYIYNRAQIFIIFFNIPSFAAHIQRFWTEIMNSAVFMKIFISQKWVLFPTWLTGHTPTLMGSTLWAPWVV